MTEPIVQAGSTAPGPGWDGPESLRLSRRGLLGGASLLALAVAVGACDGGPATDPGGQPWADGTLFDDGTGWAE